MELQVSLGGKKKRKKIKRKKGSQYIVMLSKGVTVQKSAVSVVGWACVQFDNCVTYKKCSGWSWLPVDCMPKLGLQIAVSVLNMSCFGMLPVRNFIYFQNDSFAVLFHCHLCSLQYQAFSVFPNSLQYSGMPVILFTIEWLIVIVSMLILTMQLVLKHLCHLSFLGLYFL